jgi:hypothetical protein
MTNRLPFDIREAIVQVCGKAFWLKGPLRSFFMSCGVDSKTFDRFSNEPKYTIARGVLSDLDNLGEEGFLIQRRIVTELCKLRGIPDETVPDRDAAIDALRNLKGIAYAHKLSQQEDIESSRQRTNDAKRQQVELAAKAGRLENLRKNYARMVADPEAPQKRGYALEDLLAELFDIHEIPYRRPYRTPTEQIDGSFQYRGFTYLIEARWRAAAPNEADLAAFKTKVDKKLESTRGIFLSIIPFREEVVSEFTRGISSNIVLIDGSDLSIILEGHVSLDEALDTKIGKASEEGVIYFPLRYQ